MAPPDGDRLSRILPKFQENPGKSMCLQNGPFRQLISANDWPILGKIMSTGGGDAENGASLAEISVQIRGPAPGGARLSAIFQKSQANPGQSMCRQNDPFFGTQSRLRIGQILGENHVHGRRGMVPKMGHAQPRLAPKLGPRQTAPDCPRLPKNLRKIMGNSCVPQWPHFCQLITAKGCSDLG